MNESMKYRIYGVAFAGSDRENLLFRLHTNYGVTYHDISASSASGGKRQDDTYKKMLDDVFAHSLSFDFGIDEDGLLIVGYHAGAIDLLLDDIDNDLMEATPYILKQTMKYLDIPLGSRPHEWHVVH